MEIWGVLAYAVVLAILWVAVAQIRRQTREHRLKKLDEMVTRDREKAP